MNSKHNSLNKLKLFHAIKDAVTTALRNPTLYEMQLVANMVFEIPKAINNLKLPWIKSGGVFAHYQPQVKSANFPKAISSGIEIGDLLLLRTVQRNGRKVSRSAFLLQAKKFTNPGAHPDNENQHYLYTRWPLFEYARATNILNGQKRHVTGSGLYKASKYLLILQNQTNCLSYCRYGYDVDRLLANCCCVLTAQPRLPFPMLARYKCFLEEMVNFIFGSAGKEYKKPPHRRDRNWNKVIEDLTTVTSKSISIYMNNVSGSPNTQRGQYTCFLSGDISVVLDGVLSEYKDKSLQEVENIPEVQDGNRLHEAEGIAGISIIEFALVLDDKMENE